MDRCERWEGQDGKGKISDPNVTFVARDKDWVAVSNKKLGGTWAYITGRLKYVAIRVSRENGAKFSLRIAPPLRF
jgi:putative sterol carrier protein